MNFQIPKSTGGVWYDSVMSAVHRLSVGKSIFVSLGGEPAWAYLVQPIDGAIDGASDGAIDGASDKVLARMVAPAGCRAALALPNKVVSRDKLIEASVSSVEFFLRSNRASIASLSPSVGVPAEAAATPHGASNLLHAMRALGESCTIETGSQSSADQSGAIATLIASGVDLVAADAGGILGCPTPIEAVMELMSAANANGAFIIRKCSADEIEELGAATQHTGAVHVSVEDVLAFICRETKLKPVVGRQGVPLPTAHGTFAIHAFHDVLTGLEHVALTVGDLAAPEPVLTRLHSECLTGDVFASKRCDCGEQLETSLQRLSQAGRGVLIYLRQEGRGIGLANKLKAYELQDRGLDTADANLHLGLPVDARNFALAAMILDEIGVSKVRLITNNPAKIDVLERNGIDVAGREILQAASCQHNDQYLRTKRDKLGHLLPAQ